MIGEKWLTAAARLDWPNFVCPMHSSITEKPIRVIDYFDWTEVSVALNQDQIKQEIFDEYHGNSAGVRPQHVHR